MIAWSNKSILNFAVGIDPVVRMEKEARKAVLNAVDKGWEGPPFDPIELAKIQGISVRPNAALADARVFWNKDGFQIEYNPHRPTSRVNFSIAHEIAHTFFPDCAEEVRNRSRERWDKPNWQLEVLCNIGAAELTMPVGSFPAEKIRFMTIEELMHLRKEFQVSTEAILIRLVKLTSSRVACFSATRITTPEKPPEYQINYQVESSLWSKSTKKGKQEKFRSKVLDECIAIGATSKGSETWRIEGEVHIEAVALPPLPGSNELRVVGFIRPALEMPDLGKIDYRQGNASKFTVDSNVAIMHIVNDKAMRWGPYGFAKILRKNFPKAYDDFANWKFGSQEKATLGAIHLAEVEGDNKYIVSLISQKGYGKSTKPRIQYGALDKALLDASERLKSLGVNMVQMPKIGTGQAGGNWDVIEGLILERMVSNGIQVRVIELPPH